MAEIINLRRYRKNKVRKAKDTQSDVNRALFGRTKQEKAARDDAARRLKEHLEGHKITPKTVLDEDQSPDDCA